MAFDAGAIVITAEGNVIPLKRDMLKAKKEVEKSTNRMTKQMDNVKRSGMRMSKSLLASFGLLTGAAGIALLTKSIVGIGSGFEQSMATVKGVMRASKSDFAELTSIAKKMGETTEWTASQAASALQFLGMAGFEAKEAIAALPGTLDLATAGQIDLGRAADIASNALTAYQMQASELNKVNDIFISTITRSNTNIEMMADSFRYAAPKAKAYGYELERLAAMIGTLGNAGVQGSMAGTQLSFAMGQVSKAAKMLSLGPGADLIAVLKAANEAQWDAAKVMDVFGERGGRAALVLRGLVGDVEALEVAIKAGTGEANELADTMRDTVIGRFKELKSVIEAVAIEAFTSKQSQLKDAIQGVTQTVRENKEAFIELTSSIVKATAWFFKWASLRSISKTNAEAIQYVTEGLLDFKKVQEASQHEVQAMVDWVRKLKRETEAYHDELRKRPEFEGAGVGLTGEELRKRPELSVSKTEVDKAVGLTKRVVDANKEADKAILDSRKELIEKAKALGIPVAKLQVEFEDEPDKLQKKIKQLVADVEESRINMKIDIALANSPFAEVDKELEELKKATKEAKTARESLRDIKVDVKLDDFFEDIDRLDNLIGVRRTIAVDLALEEAFAGVDRLKEELASLGLGESLTIGPERGFGKTEAEEQRKQTSESIRQLAEKAKEEQEELRAKVEQTADYVSDKGADAFMSWLDGTKSLKEAFSDMAKSILLDLTKMIIKQMIFNALMKAGSSMFGGGAGAAPAGQGAVIDPLARYRGPGNTGGMQHGGVIKRPSSFPIIPVAEKGPEGVLPLANIGGELGVKTQMPSGSQQSKQVHIHFDNIKIEAIDASSFMELTTSNPEAITVPFKNALIEGDEGLRSLLSETSN